MTKYYFSSSTLGLYVSSIHASMPGDAKEITETKYLEVRGKTLGADADGYPVVAVAAEKNLSELKDDKREEIREACHVAIVSGIDHDGYHYPTTETDQINLNGLVTRSRILGAAGEPYKFWCADVDGNWARRGHTTEQIQAVGIAVAEHVIFKQDQYEAKLTTINNATTPEVLADIN
jgi:hypothetical protein